MADDAAAPEEVTEATQRTDETAATDVEEAPDADAESAETESSEVIDYDAEADPSAGGARVRWSISMERLALVLGLIMVVTLGGLSGWLGYRSYQSHQADERDRQFVQVARQGALNLTTIDYQNADADVQRILDSATGQFYDDFSNRFQPFVEVVRKAQSKSVGTVVEAGLESQTGDEAQVIVALRVDTSNAGAPEQQPRSWRMRLTVQNVGGEGKVSNVGFVP